MPSIGEEHLRYLQMLTGGVEAPGQTLAVIEQGVCSPVPSFRVVFSWNGRVIDDYHVGHVARRSRMRRFETIISGGGYVFIIRHALAIGAISLCCFSASATADANIMCPGKIQNLGIGSDGTIHVNNGYGMWAICSVSQASSSISPSTCKAWYLSLLAAKTAQSQVAVYLSGYSSCTAAGSWVSVNAYFVE